MKIYLLLTGAVAFSIWAFGLFPTLFGIVVVGLCADRMVRWIMLAILILPLSGCPKQLPDPPCDTRVHGVCIGSPDMDLEFMSRSRWSSALETAVEYWDADIEDLEGLRIGIAGTRASIAEACGSTNVKGCQSLDIIWIYAVYPECPEKLLAHEIGHYLIDDAGHSDPRWIGAEKVATPFACW